MGTHRENLLRALRDLGLALLKQGRGEDARPVFERTIRTGREFLKVWPADDGPKFFLLYVTVFLAESLLDKGDYASAGRALTDVEVPPPYEHFPWQWKIVGPVQGLYRVSQLLRGCAALAERDGC